MTATPSAPAKTRSTPAADPTQADPEVADGGTAVPAGQEIRPLFLLSLPRSGSTLLQRLLGTHPDIATVAEPWILLPLLYTMRRSGSYAEYGHYISVEALEDFVTNLPRGWDTYRDELRRLATRLYQQAAPPGSLYFLDKTPRYALIIDEIVATFPAARFIILWRNPLAVVASAVETWSPGRWKLEDHKVDLYEGLFNLVSAQDRFSDRIHTVRYEDLVADPQTCLNAIFSFLDLPPRQTSLDDLADMTLPGDRGDPTAARYSSTITAESVTKWQQVLDNPIRRLWCRRYLEIIGRDRLTAMGYDLDELNNMLHQAPAGRKHPIIMDIAFTIRSVVRSAFETLLLREKLKRLPRIHLMHHHR